MSQTQNLRNLAIIAHVDHGKTTLVDAMLQQSGLFRENQQVEERAMDRMDQERERGITIMAKNTGVFYEGTRLNIVDTPGHADFGGEVERTLRMVDGVLLLVDASEGPLPQTRFVLQKALELNLAPLVCINKIDRQDSRPEEVLQMVYDLFIELGAQDDQLDFPVLYAVARDGWAVAGEPMGPVPDVAQRGAEPPPEEERNLKGLFDAIIEHVPCPKDLTEEPLQILVNAIGGDSYLGRLAVGRIHSGRIKKNQNVFRYAKDGTQVSERVVDMSLFEGLGRLGVEEAACGDLVCLAGMENVEPGDTIVGEEETPALSRIEVDEPTLCMMFSVSTGPFAGLDGKYVTSRHIRDRLLKETRGNVSIKIEETAEPDKFKVLGRGELQLSVLIETMRREGYEMCVSRPEVVVKEIDGRKMEPLERLVINTPETVVGSVTEALGKRRGVMHEMETLGGGWVRVDFKVPTRGLIGFRSLFLTLTRGEGTMSTLFEGWTPWMGDVDTRMNGAIVAIGPGKTTPYALFNLQPRGVLFVGNGVDVYEGMVIGEHSRDNDIDVQACREKKLTNVRASGKDEAVVLTPPRQMSLEKTIEWIDMDELVEVTPNHVRIRKRVLKANMRPKKKTKLEE